MQVMKNREEKKAPCCKLKTKGKQSAKGMQVGEEEIGRERATMLQIED
jgi:hypothetical protein